MNKQNISETVIPESLTLAVSALGSFAIFCLLILITSAFIQLIQRQRQKARALKHITFSILDIPMAISLSSSYASLRRNIIQGHDSKSVYHSYEHLAMYSVKREHRRNKLKETDDVDYLSMRLYRNVPRIDQEQRKFATLSGSILIKPNTDTEQDNSSRVSTLERCLTNTRTSSDSSNHYDNLDDFLGIKPPRTSRSECQVNVLHVPQGQQYAFDDDSDNVTIRRYPETQVSGDDTRVSGMSALLRSSWMTLAPMSSALPDGDIAGCRCASKGAFIPEKTTDKFDRISETKKSDSSEEPALRDTDTGEASDPAVSDGRRCRIRSAQGMSPQHWTMYRNYDVTLSARNDPSDTSNITGNMMFQASRSKTLPAVRRTDPQPTRNCVPCVAEIGSDLM